MQLKIYIQEHSFFPQMDTSYVPVAANSTTMSTLLGISHYTPTSLSADNILFFCPLAATVLALIIITIVLTLYACGGICKLKSNTKTTLKKQDKATVVALSIVSFVRILTFIGLDSAAVHFIYSCSNLRVEALCEFSNLIHNTPVALLVCDICAFVAFIIIAAIIPQLATFWHWIPSAQEPGQSVTTRLKNCLLHHHSDPPGPEQASLLESDQNQTPDNQSQSDQLQYYCCALSVICFIFSCLVHTPYVAMAYLSDAHYATSILIYYTTILFIEFGIIQYTITFYFDSESLIYQRKYWTIILVVVLLVLMYCLVLSASFFYYYIPMINVVTNLPNEGVVVYQTAIVLTGAYITYKTLIKVEKDEQNVNDGAFIHLTNLKEAEIALLESEIDYETDPDKIKNLKERRLSLRKEIMLGCIQSSISTLKSESNNIVNAAKTEILTYLGKVECLKVQTDQNPLTKSQNLILNIREEIKSLSANDQLQTNATNCNSCRNLCGFSCNTNGQQGDNNKYEMSRMDGGDTATANS